MSIIAAAKTGRFSLTNAKPSIISASELWKLDLGDSPVDKLRRSRCSGLFAFVSLIYDVRGESKKVSF